MKKLAVMVLMASISLTACGNKAVKADSIEVMKNIEETTSIEEASSEEETTSIEETNTIEEETSTIEEATTMEEETNTIEEETSIIEETSNISTESTYTISETEMTMYTVKGCNIRQGASTEYDVIGTLGKGEAVKITGKVNEVNWYEISYGEGKGYVSGSLLVSEKPAEEQVPSQPEQPAQTQQPEQPAQPPQQPAQPEQPASSDAPINPNTGQPMKPGESYIAPNGVEVTYVTDDFLFSLEW